MCLWKKNFVNYGFIFFSILTKVIISNSSMTQYIKSKNRFVGLQKSNKNWFWLCILYFYSVFYENVDKINCSQREGSYHNYTRKDYQSRKIYIGYWLRYLEDFPKLYYDACKFSFTSETFERHLFGLISYFFIKLPGGKRQLKI